VQTILTAYTPVYLYSYTLLLFLPLLHFLLVRLVPPPQRSSAQGLLFPRLVRVVPGIVWPDFWSSGGVTVRQCGRGEPAGVKEEEGEDEQEDGEDTSRLLSSRQLLKPDDLAASLMHHTAVLLTFGVTNPVLAVAVTLTICLQILQWVMLLNRFVFKRLLLSGMWGQVLETPSSSHESAATATTAASTTAPASAAVLSLRRDELVGDVIAVIERERRGSNVPGVMVGTEVKRSTRPYDELDQCLTLAESSVHNFDALLSLCVLPVVLISCVFFVFFSWDIAADRLGAVQSVWVPVVAAAVPFVLILFFLSSSKAN
jgi:hypothetical protein